jgi:hypothetical protein
MHWFAFMRPRGRGVARQAGLKAIQDLRCKIQEMGNAKSQGPEFCRVADININVGATPRCAMAILAMPRHGQDARGTSGPNIPSIRSPDVLIPPLKTADMRSATRYSSGRIELAFAPINEARKKADIVIKGGQWERMPISAWKRRKARRGVISPLGEVEEAHG